MAENKYNLRKTRNYPVPDSSEDETNDSHLEFIQQEDTEQLEQTIRTDQSERVDFTATPLLLTTGLFADRISRNENTTSIESIGIPLTRTTTEPLEADRMAPTLLNDIPPLTDSNAQHPLTHPLPHIVNTEPNVVNTTVQPTQTIDMNLLVNLMTNLSNKIEQSSADLKSATKSQIQEINANFKQQIDQTKVELTQIFNTKIDETQQEIQACRTAFESQLRETRENQIEIRLEINSIKLTQNSQAEETAKLNDKLMFKIEDSQNQMRQFVLDSISQQQSHSEIKHQQYQNDIITTVKSKLEEHKLNFEQKIEELTTKTQLDNERNSKTNLTALQNEVLPKLTLQTKMIEAQQLEIQTLNSNLIKCETEVRSIKQSNSLNIAQGPIQVICNGNDSNDRQLPKFNGRSGNPNEYLRKLKRYYDRGIERNQNYDTTEYLKDILETSFEGPASRWLQLIKSEITSWSQFATEFEAKYWSQAVQRGIRSKIESEKYRPNGTLSRTEYLTERVLLLQSMTPSLNEEEIISLMAERFDSIVQDSISVQNITTIRSLERLLQKEDIRDGPKKTRNHNQHNSRPNSPPNQNQQNYNDRYANQRAYQPKMNTYPHYQSNNYHQQNNQQYRSNQPNHKYNNQNNYQNYNRNHHENKPYQRNQYPQRSQDQNYRQERNHPTNEQAQLCAIFRQNPNPPNIQTQQPMSPHHENSVHPSSSTSPQRQGNESAL